MLDLNPVIVNLAVALGIGLLIGGERERRKNEGQAHAPAGLRTFTFASLAGAISMIVGGELVLAVTVAGVTALTALAYWRTQENDPGLTTEVALIVIVLLGALATQQPGLAASIAVAAAILLAARTPLHHFVRSVLTEDEGKDALIFAGASLVVLPLLPDRPMGPYDALNPYAIWLILVLVMGISAAGYIAVRILGARFGLPIAGFASGFISSTATIGAMGTRAVKTPSVLAAAVAGAVLSTIATIVQMAAIVATIDVLTLRALAGPLISAGVAAVAYGAYFTIRALRQKTDDEPQKGQAFSLSTALGFSATLAVILLVSAALREWFGETGAIVAAAAAGFVDTHAAAISIVSMVAAGKMSAAEAVVPILAGLTTNTVSKMIFARTSGGTSFAVRVIPGLILVALAAWVGSLVRLVAN
jgi:uncharacterized membrane protein (DUF4010 family)